MPWPGGDWCGHLGHFHDELCLWCDARMERLKDVPEDLKRIFTQAEWDTFNATEKEDWMNWHSKIGALNRASLEEAWAKMTEMVYANRREAPFFQEGPPRPVTLQMPKRLADPEGPGYGEYVEPYHWPFDFRRATRSLQYYNALDMAIEDQTDAYATNWKNAARAMMYRVRDVLRQLDEAYLLLDREEESVRQRAHNQRDDHSPSKKNKKG